MSKIIEIPIEQLKPGMFLHEMNISWVCSPFLRHRRKIEKAEDVQLLIKAGATKVSIDLDKGIGPDDIENSSDKKIISKATPEENSDQQQFTETKAEETSQPQYSLNQEIFVVSNIKNKIDSLVNDLNKKVKSGKPIELTDCSELINDTVESIKRYDQGVLHITHRYRSDVRLEEHAFGVFGVVLLLAVDCELSEQDIEMLGMAALIHDCGWACLPMNLLGKGKRYSSEENKLVHQHVPLATHILKKSPQIPAEVIQLVEQHQEYSNGKGYPKHLNEGGLHRLHHYLQVADLYDEYIHGYTDQPAMLAVNALKTLYQKSVNGLFPQDLISRLVRIMGVYPMNTVARLSSNEIIVVTEINRKLPLLPIVNVVIDSDGKVLDNPIRLDLSTDHQKRLITEVLEHDRIPTGIRQ